MPQSLARLKPQKTNTFSKDGGHSLTMICSVGTLLLICRDQGGMDALIKYTNTVLCMCEHAQLLESCPTLCDPVDCTVAAPPKSPLSMGFSRQEYWSGLPCPPPGIFLTQGSNPCLLCLLDWQADSLPLAPPGNFLNHPNFLKPSSLFPLPTFLSAL